MVYRIYVEKKDGFDIEAKRILDEIHSFLRIDSVKSLRLLNRYDAEGISPELFERCIPTVFSEPQVDNVFFELPGEGCVFGIEYLPGQFDQRAHSAAECIRLISRSARPVVAAAKIIVLDGDIAAGEIDRIKKYLINPVDSREAGLGEKASLTASYPVPERVETLEGFNEMDEKSLRDFISERGLAMDFDDILFCQKYFKSENRTPTITEIRIIDTYWSDHCRHTTFGTRLTGIEIEDERVLAAYKRYRALRQELYGDSDKPVSLMDIATIGAKKLKADGRLKNLDESEEINACTVKCRVDENGREKDWLLLFKNETHNHPTEIEPFGGAATCIGGAIRDPLSGRGYVYQAMRVTGAGDPLEPVFETLPGKLPQRKIIVESAQGYSSYGNQIGVATGQVDELYHPGYAAKRMEIGAVLGAVPAGNVRREVPLDGDRVVLIGGRTGRDGCGGATGSSKPHKTESLESCGAEVQKGNAPVERKLQRLFRNPEAARLVKRCNDFGAGGVCVAVGELADGMVIDLDRILKKYSGLDGTELAISESQERMAVVLSPGDTEKFLSLARRENLEATVIARISKVPRLRMNWNGETIADISREFLNSNGAPKTASVKVPEVGKAPKAGKVGKVGMAGRGASSGDDRGFSGYGGASSGDGRGFSGDDRGFQGVGRGFSERLGALVRDLNVACKKGLAERFDSTIGAGTVLMPFGGKYQLTPAMAMVAKLPVLNGETKTCSGMAWGYNPYISERDPYRGAYLAVVESVSRLVAAGFSPDEVYLTFQEYFERLGNDPERWGKPFSSLLGALDAQLDLGIAAIGGKDSMSGSFENLHVPPTLVSFAVAPGKTESTVSPEFKKTGSKVALIKPERRDDLLPDPESLAGVFQKVRELGEKGLILSASTPAYGGIAESLFKMCLGNRIGVLVNGKGDGMDGGIGGDEFFGYSYGSFILELPESCGEGITLGHTIDKYEMDAFGEKAGLFELQKKWEDGLSGVMPFKTGFQNGSVQTVSYHAALRTAAKIKTARPHALIPVFPGTNCEYDTARALERAGAEAEIFVINNLTPDDISESCKLLGEKIKKSQLLVIPGGFSGGDEPDGSAKFITAFFRSPAVFDAVHVFLSQRDGLMLGICNGFQALIKLGLVPFGEIREMDAQCPTLTFNKIGRHQSMLVTTRISSDLSPWFSKCPVGECYTIPVSHGEGRFVAPQSTLDSLLKTGRIAAQYVDSDGLPSMDPRYNPNGSMLAVEAITSPDGRILGKMAHSERSGEGLYKNVCGNHYQPLFEGGVDYFR